MSSCYCFRGEVAGVGWIVIETGLPARATCDVVHRLLAYSRRSSGELVDELPQIALSPVLSPVFHVPRGT
jgi:hypothetical protein